MMILASPTSSGGPRHERPHRLARLSLGSALERAATFNRIDTRYGRGERRPPRHRVQRALLAQCAGIRRAVIRGIVAVAGATWTHAVARRNESATARIRLPTAKPSAARPALRGYRHASV